MSRRYRGRWCNVFHCDRRGDRYCCIDCPKTYKSKCCNPCQNDPSRCRLEDTNRKKE